MKKFAIALVVLLILACGALFFAVSRAGSIIEGYKPELEKMASESLGATVTLGDLSAKIFPNASVVVDSAKVANPDNPEEAITVDNLSLNLELFPLLTGNVVITSLNVINPTIVASLEEEGIFIEGLPRGGAENSNGGGSSSGSGGGGESPSSNNATTASATEAVTVDLRAFQITGASLTVNDAIADTKYTINEFDLKASMQYANNKAHMSNVRGEGRLMEVSDFSYSGDSIRYDLADATIGFGKVQPKIGSSYVTLDGDLNLADASKVLSINSSNLDIEDFRPLLAIFFPTLNEYGIRGKAQPDLKFHLTSTGYTAKGTIGVSDFHAGIEDLIGLDGLKGVFTVDSNENRHNVASDALSGNLNGAPITVAMKAGLDAEQGKISPMTVTGFGGTSSVDTALDKTQDTMPFTAKLNTEGMLIQELVPAFAPDMDFGITGTVKSVTGNVNGTLDENILASVTGQIQMLIGDGLIKDVNLGEEVLGSITELPFLSAALIESVPEDLRHYLTDPHTALEEVSGTFDLKNETMHTKNLKVVSDYFSFVAEGTIGFDTELDLDSVVKFKPDFSARMVKEVKELSALLDKQGRLSFPVKITGIPPELDTEPKLDDMLGDVVENKVRQELQNQISDQVGDDLVGGVVNELIGGSGGGKSSGSSVDSLVEDTVGNLLSGDDSSAEPTKKKGGGGGGGGNKKKKKDQ